MPIRICSALGLAMVFTAGFGIGMQAAWADGDGNVTASTAESPLYQGPYATVMGSYVRTDDHSQLEHGFGGLVGGGFRKGAAALELRGIYVSEDPASIYGGSLNGLVFPFERLPGLYGLLGVGAHHVSDHPNINDNSFNVTFADAGLGYIFPLRIGRYQFGIRAEGLYQFGKRQKREQDQKPPTGDLPVESTSHEAVVNVGLQLPFGLLPPPPAAPPPEPVQVVDVPKPIDSDGDGVTDDLDQCPNTPPNTKVDARGCPLPPPCRAPAPGERISLEGCGTGDTIVLRGVNFEFNKAKLTVNAKAILDNVAAELKSHPDIKVEVGGHTDGKGTVPYNQKLSERRAASVQQYLVGAGIDAGRMTSAGFGKSKPIADNSTDEGRELNRRVELRITDSAPLAPAAEPPSAAPPVATEPSPPPPTAGGDSGAAASTPSSDSVPGVTDAPSTSNANGTSTSAPTEGAPPPSQ